MRITVLFCLLLLVSCESSGDVEIKLEYQEASHCKLTDYTSYCKIFQSGKEFCIYTQSPKTRIATSNLIDCDIFDAMEKVKVENE